MRRPGIGEWPPLRLGLWTCGRGASAALPLRVLLLLPLPPPPALPLLCC